MSTFGKCNRDWIETNIETARILHFIADPHLKDDFVKRVIEASRRFSTEQQLKDHCAALDPEKIKGFHKTTVGDLDLRSYRDIPPSTGLGIDIPPQISMFGDYGTPYPNNQYQPEADPPVIYNRFGPRPSHSSGSERTAMTLYGAHPCPANDPYQHYPPPNKPHQDNPYQTNRHPQTTARPDDSIPEAARPYTKLTDYVEKEPGKKPKTSNEQASRRSRGSPPSSHGDHGKSKKPKPSNEQASRRSRGSPPSSHGDHSKSLTKSGGKSDRRERRG